MTAGPGVPGAETPGQAPASVAVAERYRHVVLDGPQALREHLDGLNEMGTPPVAVGIDATPQPFLITLVGPYAESEDVFFDSPWQSDVQYGERVDGEWVPRTLRCDECQAPEPHTLSDLRFPVVVLAQQADSATPESALPSGSDIFRVVCDQHVNGHGAPGGWYPSRGHALDSIDAWWRRKHPACTGWRVERRSLSPWRPVDA